MRCSDNGLKLIQSFEGCKLTAYLDTRGIPTIGVGHTGPEVHMGLTWTQDQADSQFASDIAQKAETPVNGCVSVGLSQNQFDALCSLCFNIGGGNFRASTLVKLINAGNFDGAPDQFMRWCHNHDGSINAGLQRRRQAEIDLWSAA